MAGGGSDADRTLVEEEEGEGEVDESLRATTPEEQSEEDIDEVGFMLGWCSSVCLL